MTDTGHAVTEEPNGISPGVLLRCECGWERAYTDKASAVAAYNRHLPQVDHVDVESAGRVSGERADDERP